MKKTLYDEIILHNITLEEYKNERTSFYLRKLNSLNNEIKAEVLNSTSVYTKKRYEELMTLIRRCSKELFFVLYNEEIEDFIENEIEFYTKLFNKYNKKKEPSISTEALLSLLLFTPIGSESTVTTAISAIVDKFINIWDMSLRTTYLTKDTTRNTIRNVLGGVNVNGIPVVGNMNVLKNSIERFTSTEIQALTQNTIKQLSNKYGNTFDGWKWVAILDNKTCITCGELHNKEFTDMNEIPQCPLHIHCRCCLIPIIKGETPNYETYSEWFEEQSESDKEQILGKSRYKMYKNGAKISSFVANNKLLTLSQLRDR